MLSSNGPTSSVLFIITPELLHRGTIRSFEIYSLFNIERSFQGNCYYENTNISSDQAIICNINRAILAGCLNTSHRLIKFKRTRIADFIRKLFSGDSKANNYKPSRFRWT